MLAFGIAAQPGYYVEIEGGAMEGAELLATRNARRLYGYTYDNFLPICGDETSTVEDAYCAIRV